MRTAENIATTAKPSILLVHHVRANPAVHVSSCPPANNLAASSLGRAHTAAQLSDQLVALRLLEHAGGERVRVHVLALVVPGLAARGREEQLAVRGLQRVAVRYMQRRGEGESVC